MDLSALADFHLVAAAGSLGKASRDSDRPKATLSRRIRQLEESLGVRLLERGHSALRLTPEGRALYERTRAQLHDIQDVGQNLTSDDGQPHGLLRVSAPLLFSNAVGGYLAAKFALRYPDVQIDLIASDRYVDLVEEGFDVVVRVNPRPTSELVGRCFVRDPMLIVAPPSLPMPRTDDPEAAPHVPAVALFGLANIGAWRFEADGRSYQVTPDYRLRLSSLAMVHAAALAGAGAAMLPRSLTDTDIASGRLTSWGTYSARTTELWVLHNSRRLVSPKVSAFVEFLVESFPEQRFPHCPQ